MKDKVIYIIMEWNEYSGFSTRSGPVFITEDPYLVSEVFHDLLEQYEKKNYKERWLELEVYEIEKPKDLKEYCVEA